MSIFTPENQLIIAACSIDPDYKHLQYTFSGINDWDAACDRLIRKGLSSLFLELITIRYPQLSQRVPTELLDELKYTRQQSIKQSKVLSESFREIALAMRAKRIKLIALNGIYQSRSLYPRMGLRTLTTIDLLFLKDELESALEVFDELDFELKNTPVNEFVYEPLALLKLKRNNIPVKLHTRLQAPYNVYNFPEKDLFDRAEMTSLYAAPCYVFDLYDQLLYLCIDLDRQLMDSKVDFNYYADLSRLLANNYNEINWHILIDRCEAYGCEAPFFNQAWIGVKYFNMPLPTEISQSIENWEDKNVLERSFSSVLVV
jgi:hypothetical protein